MTVETRHLGRQPYAETWALQKTLVEDRIAGRIPDQLLIVEHDPVITLGRRRRDAASGILGGVPVVAVERGGLATYHGPGQVVAYPIVHLQERRLGIPAFLRILEEAVIETLGAYDLASGRREGATGVWVRGGAGKICSIGIAVRRWVTYHGLALNVATDLAPFHLIDPCGFEPSVMTTMNNELPGGPSADAVGRTLAVALVSLLQ